MTKNDERVGTERGLGRNFHCYPTGEGEWFFFLQRRLQHNVSHHQRRQLYLHLMTRKIAQKELLIVVVCCHLTSSPGLGPCMIVLPPSCHPRTQFVKCLLFSISRLFMILLLHFEAPPTTFSSWRKICYAWKKKVCSRVLHPMD